MEIRLLGGVSALDDAGAQLDVGPAKCQIVLATLALSPGAAVPMWRLVETLWGDDPPRTAERTLQSYIARLRKGLGAGVIARSGGAYVLDIPTEAVDVARFERSLDEGDVGTALAEWVGAPLAGLDASGLDSAVTGLTERWLGAVEADLARRVDADPSGVVGRLTELTASHPFREGLWALLMKALYHVGRQADALAAYRSARDHLVEQLGVEPGPQLQQLEMQILRHDGELGTAPLEAKEPVAARPTGTVTFAFCDIEGASHWWAADRDAMAEAMTGFQQLATRLASRHEGYVFSRGGDSLGVAFSRTDGACEWATELQAAVAREQWPGGIDLRVRVGLHTGLADERDGSYFGPAVNVAVDLAAAGHGGQTLLSGVTSGLLKDVVTRDLGWYRLDDVVAEQHLFQLGDEEHPPLRLEDRFRGNLPRRLGRLIGRDDELQVISAALDEYPLVTLVGPGGIGKTSLALVAAGRIKAGGDSWLIELAEVDSGQHVVRTVAETLGVSERQGATLTRCIVETLQSRQTLLVLDNCEHVIDAVAELTDAITRGCDRVRVLATSRERLGLPGERIITVPPLDPSGSAADLFEERALAASTGFVGGSSRSVVEEICGRLDGMPLAIELVAARTSTMTPEDLVERLQKRVQILDGAQRRGANRHRTLRSAIQWSYDLLTAQEQRLFRRLSIFTGGFDLEGAEWVGATTPEDAAGVDMLLSRLTEQSLLAVESGPFGRRFRMLEPIREFGRDLLTDSGEFYAVSERHARWCLCEATGVHNMISGWDEIEGVARLAELWPNLRTAFDWACSVDERELARNLFQPILSEIIVRSNNEIGEWAEQLLEMTPADDDEGRVFGLYAAAHRYSMTQDPASYERLLERYGAPEHVLMHHARAIATEDHELMAEWAPAAVEEFRKRGDQHLAERAEINIAGAWLNLGQFERCDRRLEELLERYRAQGPPTFINWTLFLLGYSAAFQGRQDRADALFDQGIDIEVPPRTHTPSKPLEARAAFRKGNRIRAFRILQDHIDELLVTDNMQAGVIDCIEFINMMAAIGRIDAAGAVLRHLESTGLFDAPGWRSLVEESAEIIAAGPAGDFAATEITGDRHALEYMGEVLEGLAG